MHHQAHRSGGLRGALLICLLIPLLNPSHLIAGEATQSEQLAQVAAQFEHNQDQSFKNSGAALEVWRRGKRLLALKTLIDLFDAAPPADRLFCAYQVLSLDPTNRATRQAFPAGKAPLDATGVRVADVPVPLCTNRTLLTKVSNLKFPPFSEVSSVVALRSSYVAGYWHSMHADLADLRTHLLALGKQGDQEGAYQSLAYYWPTCHEVEAYYAAQGKPIPRQRTWFSGVDRYLLDHELAGVDCLDTKLFKPFSGSTPSTNGTSSQLDGDASWQFMEKMRNCRLETLVTAHRASSFDLTDDHGNGCQMVLDGTSLVLNRLDGGSAIQLQVIHRAVDAGSTPSMLQLEARGRSVRAFDDGDILASLQLPQDIAFSRISVHAAGMTAEHLRVRFLSDAVDVQDRQVVEQVKKIAVVAPPPEPWRAQRNKQLDAPVSFHFDDTPVDSAIGLLAQLTGVHFTFDGTAETLKEMPVTFSGKNMKLSSALEWLKRVSDISWSPSADGILLTWQK